MLGMLSQPTTNTLHRDVPPTAICSHQCYLCSLTHTPLSTGTQIALSDVMRTASACLLNKGYSSTWRYVRPFILAGRSGQSSNSSVTCGRQTCAGSISIKPALTLLGHSGVPV